MLYNRSSQIEGQIRAQEGHKGSLELKLPFKKSWGAPGMGLLCMIATALSCSQQMMWLLHPCDDGFQSSATGQVGSCLPAVRDETGTLSLLPHPWCLECNFQTTLRKKILHVEHYLHLVQTLR